MGAAEQHASSQIYNAPEHQQLWQHVIGRAIQLVNDPPSMQAT